MADRMWICPECGNRFVTKNSWHSCGQFSLEALFSDSEPWVIDVAGHLIEELRMLGDVEVVPQRTRLTVVARVRFAGLVPRKRGFVTNFALRYRVDHDRIATVEQHGPKWWTHHVRVSSVNDIDDQLLRWLQESHDTVGTQHG